MTAQAERAAIVAFIRQQVTRIAEADRGEKWPTAETCGDIGLLVALAVEIERGAHGRVTRWPQSRGRRRNHPTVALKAVSLTRCL